MRALASAGRRPLAVHVGADGLQNTKRWTDMHLYRRVLEHAGLPPGVLRLGFVEPVVEKTKQFWRHVGRLPVAPSQVSLVTAMVDNCTRPEAKMYKISEQASRDFGMDISMARGWVSADPWHPVTITQYWAEHDMPVRCANGTGDCRSLFKQFANAWNMTRYFEEIQIRCLNLKEIIETELGAQVEDLAMLVVDAEGLDERILLSLAGSSAFEPGFVMWEKGKDWRPSTAADLLRGKGYKVGMKLGSEVNPDADAPNMIAVLGEIPEQREKEHG
uniref:Methyltransferase FkbM domain-containing protein n=1 Tax=Alexandrium catenella TaxID=2925 RepID=A0A7S1QMG0_ALECA|mmetsp:Transcript_35227/g.95509  ORF Transcript_35227/g.95509 Transcript_35227/m.95509 type:complete len:274 (+) Transcript_35227:1-822(+)